MRSTLTSWRDAAFVAFATLVAIAFVVFGAASGLPVFYGIVVTVAVFAAAIRWLPSDRRPQSWVKWIGPAWALLFLSTLGFDYAFNLGSAEAVRRDLERESALISPMPGSIEKGHSLSNKTHQALVGRNYQTNSTWGEVVAYYTNALAASGWAYMGQTTIRDWGQDLGGRDACYSKGAYRTHLQYAGESAHYGWDYAFDMTWGLGDCGQ